MINTRQHTAGEIYDDSGNLYIGAQEITTQSRNSNYSNRKRESRHVKAVPISADQSPIDKVKIKRMEQK